MVFMEIFNKKFMKNTKFNFSILICLLSLNLFAQETKLLLNNGNLTSASYYLYNPILKINALYNDTTEAVNQYPEQLMISIISSNSKAWEKYNSLNFDENESFTPSNDSSLKYELLSKFEFKANGSDMAIIKFNITTLKSIKIIAGVTVMQKVSGKWKTTSTTYTTKISLAFLVFKAEVMNNLIFNSPINEMEKQLLNNVYSKGLDFDKLLQQTFTKEQKNYFINPLNW